MIFTFSFPVTLTFIVLTSNKLSQLLVSGAMSPPNLNLCSLFMDGQTDPVQLFMRSPRKGRVKTKPSSNATMLCQVPVPSRLSPRNWCKV